MLIIRLLFLILDFSVAFDGVNHEPLIFKLGLLSLGGAFLSIFEFLT